VNAWTKAPQFIFGTPEEWKSAARAAELLKKMIADTERRGKKPSEDLQIIEFYASSPGLATFYEREGSRRSKYVSPQRKAIEADGLWDRFAAAAREKEATK
jgi:hypothetical protein